MAQPDNTHTRVEDELREAIWTGRLVDRRTGDATADDPTNGADWAAPRTVAAALVAELLTSTEKPRRPRALRLAGARITGALDLESAELICPLLLHGCWLDKPINLGGAKIPTLVLSGCRVPGLNGKQLQTQGDLSIEGTVVDGKVVIAGGRVGGNLDLSGATITNQGGGALLADALNIHENLLGDGLKACGEVDLDGASIIGFADFTGARVDNRNGRALHAEALSTGRSLALSDGFSAHGEVSLLRARIGGSLDFSGASLVNPDGCALFADGLIVTHNVAFREGFRAEGEIDLLGANIGGQIDFSGATLIKPDGIALDLQQAQLQRLILRPPVTPRGIVSLIYTEIGVLADAVDAWPETLGLTGLVYQTLRERTRFAVRDRLRWLERNEDGYTPQPYEQLAAVYRHAGRDQDARTVAIAKQRTRRRTLGLAGRLWSRLLDGLVGYGYRTWLAGVWLTGFWLVGWAVFDHAHRHHELTLARPGEPHPAFHGAAYALDTLLPVVDLRQQATWIPHGTAQWWAWTSILAGWVLTTAVVAALTGLLKRD